MREGVSPTRGAKIVDLRPVPATYQTSRAKKRKPPPDPSIITFYILLSKSSTAARLISSSSAWVSARLAVTPLT